MVLQMAGAAIVGILFYLRNFRAYIMSFFRRRKPQDDSPALEANDEQR
jgi:hypothetical protein